MNKRSPMYLLIHCQAIPTRSLGLRNGGDEGQEIAAAKEFGEKQSGVALCFRSVNPQQAWPQRARLAASLPENSAPVAAHLYPSLLFSSLLFYFNFRPKPLLVLAAVCLLRVSEPVSDWLTDWLTDWGGCEPWLVSLNGEAASPLNSVDIINFWVEL